MIPLPAPLQHRLNTATSKIEQICDSDHSAPVKATNSLPITGCHSGGLNLNEWSKQMASEMNVNSEIRTMSHDEIDAVAGGATAVIEIKVPGVTVTTVINPDVSGVVLQYSSGGIEGKRV
jgi:hypothetical protein